MIQVLGYLLGSLSIRNLSFAYFFMAPFFLNQGLRYPLGPIFLAGYLMSLPILVLAASRALCNLDYRATLSRPAWIVLGLAAACMASVAINTPHNLGRFEKSFFWYLKFLIPALCFLIMSREWRREDFSRLYTLLFTLVLLSLGMTVTQAVVDIPPIIEQGRFSSFFRDSNHYAVLLNVLIAFTLPIGVSRLLVGSHRIGYILLNLVLLVAVGLTGSRSGFLTTALLIGISVLATRSWRINLSLAAAVTPILIFFVLVVQQRYTGGKAALSDLGRLWTYMAALNMIAANPLSGVGFGNILDVFQEYGRLYAALIGRPMDIHNAFLEIFAEAGVVGFTFFSILILYPTWKLGRRAAVDSRHYYPMADLAGFNIAMVFLVHGMVYPEYLGRDDFWVYWSLVIALLRARIRDPGFEFRLFADLRSPAAGPSGNGPGKL